MGFQVPRAGTGGGRSGGGGGRAAVRLALLRARQILQRALLCNGAMTGDTVSTY